MITKQTKFVSSTALALFVLALLSLIFGVRYLLAQGERLESYLTQSAVIATQERLFTEAEGLLEASALDRATMTDYFLTESETINFLSDIEASAVLYNVSLVTDSLQVLEEKDKPKELEVKFSLEGNETPIKDFIELIETLPYASYIYSLSIKEDSLNNISTARLTVRVLLLP